MTEQLHDRDAERAVLSCCVYSTNARKIAREHLVREDFWEPWHERLWVAMEELDASDRAVDPLTLASAVTGNKACLEVLPAIITLAAVPDNVSVYAEVVRGWAVRRRAMDVARGLLQRARSLEQDPYGLITDTINRLTGLRDTGSDAVETRLLADLLAEADDPYDWAVPGLLEKADRLVLTGEEGLGKSYVARQLGIFAAAGIHPFLMDRIEPVRVQILDHENSWSQIRRGSRRLWNFAAAHGEDPSSRVHVAALSRIDITRDRDLSRLHREVDIANPDVIVVGPLYKLTPRAIQTDDEAAPILAALDTLRERGCALVIEAHAGHARGSDGDRDLRPRGSSALMGWPEFGYGMRAMKDGRCRLVPWRGDRSERGWPQYLRRAVDPATRSTHWVPDLSGEVA